MSDLRERVKAAAADAPKPKAKKVWQQPTMDDFADGEVLSFDQTYSNTGWCRLSVKDGAISIIDYGTIREAAPPGLSSHELVIQRAVWMNDRITTIVTKYADEPDLDVVGERPAVAGKRIESSLLACLGLWNATEKHMTKSRLALIGKQHMAAVLCPPDERSEKKHITAALIRLGLDVAKGWNEHNRDALANGLTYLWDRKNR